MTLIKTMTMTVLAGATVLAMTAPQAEARNGRNAALIAGVLAGGAIAAAAAASDDDRPDYQPVGWYGDGWRGNGWRHGYYDGPRYYRPAYRYGYYDGPRYYRPAHRYYGDYGYYRPRHFYGGYNFRYGY